MRISPVRRTALSTVLACVAVVTLLAGPSAASTSSSGAYQTDTWTVGDPLGTVYGKNVFRTDWGVTGGVVDGSKTLSIPLFNGHDGGACGNLTSVGVRLDGAVAGDIQLESTDASPQEVTGTLSAELTLTRPDNSTLVVALPEESRNETFTAHDGTVDFGGTSGATYTGVTAEKSESVTLTGADLALFTFDPANPAVTTIELPVGARATSRAVGPGNVASVFNTFAAAHAEIIYNYETCPGFDVTKDDGGANVGPGGTVVYNIDYTNTGEARARNTVVTDTVPPNTTFNASASSPGWSCANGAPAGTECTNDVGSVNGGASGSVNFAVKLDRGVSSSVTKVSNTATVRSTGNPPGPHGEETNGTPGEDSDDTPIVRVPGLSVTKIDGDATFSEGSTVAYTIAVTNTGSADAYNVVAVDTLPPGTSFVSAGSTSGWTCAAGECSFAIGTLAPDQTVNLTMVTRLDAPVAAGVTSVTNSVVADDGPGGAPPATTTEDTPVDPPALDVDKSDDDAVARPGQTILYTIDVTNNGGRTAHAVVLTETVPVATSFDASASSSGWSCADGSAAGTTCTFALGDLAPGATGDALFSVRVDDPFAAGIDSIDNTVVARTSDGIEGQDDEDTPSGVKPNLGIVKDDGGVRTTPGGEVVYGLVVTNSGEQTASNVVVTDTVPANTTFSATGSTAGWSCADGAPAGTNCTFSIGSMSAGDSQTVDFAVKVDTPLLAGVTEISNAAGVDDGPGGSEPAADDDDTPVDAKPVLEIAKDDGLTLVMPGQTVAYTIGVTNVGDIEATDVVLYDTVPAGSTFNAAESAPGWSCADGAPAGTACTLDAGDLAGGGGTFITVFAVDIDDPAPFDVLTNVAVADDGPGGADSVSDDDIDAVVRSSIGDFVWYDVNGDGVQDSGEPGLGGVTVNLSSTCSDITATTVTDATGFYEFTGLGPCDTGYVVTVDTTTLPGGATASYDRDGGLDSTTNVPLEAGADLVDVDFGYTGTGTLGDTVFDDVNDNGVEDEGEGGIGGAEITVTYAGPDDICGTDDDVVWVVLTDADGQYLVDGLLAGEYCVEVTGPPAGYDATTPEDIEGDLEAGETDLTFDFGYHGTGSLGDRVWLDIDGNGVQDSYEPGIPGVIVRVVNTCTGTMQQTTTGEDGIYGFTGLGPCEAYQVSVEPMSLPYGLTPSYDLTGEADGRAQADLTAGQNRTDVDFGYEPQPADLSLTKRLAGELVNGSTASYMLTVTNHGPGDHPLPVVFVDELPEGLTYDGFVGEGWECLADGQLVTCGFLDGLEVGQTALVELRVKVSVAPGATVTNEAVLLPTAYDRTPGNDTDIASGTLAPAPATPPPAETPVAPAPGSTPVASSNLPRTGAEHRQATTVAVWALLIGSALVTLERRRRRSLG